MGCNCKQVRKIQKHITPFVIPEYEKKGMKKILKVFGNWLWKMLGCCIVFIFMIIALPIVLSMAIVSYIKKGEMLISLPFLKKQKEMNN